MSRRPGLSAERITSLATELFGGEQVEIAPVGTPGMETQAFRVESARATRCLRIGFGLGGFRKDAWAASTFGDVLPVPKVRAMGELPGGNAYCLSDWAPGETVQDLTPDQVQRITPLVFEAWTRLQAGVIDRTSGFGLLDPDTLTGPYRSHRERLRADLAGVEGWPDDWTDGRQHAISAVVDRVGSLIDACPEERGLVHGDWGTNNILAEDDRVTAILDWEAAEIGDPLQDIAGRFWEFWPPVSTCVRAQADHADRQLGRLPDYRARVLCHDLLTGISEITESLADGEHDFAERCLDQCLELLETYIP